MKIYWIGQLGFKRWRLHISQEWKRIRLYFNWAPSQFHFGANITLSDTGFEVYINLWFNFQFTCYFGKIK